MKQNEKGSVTMIVAVTIFFIVILLSSFFIYTTSRRRAQIEETERIAEAYDGDMDAVYAEEISKQDRDLFDYDPPTEGISLKDGEKYLCVNVLSKDNQKFNFITKDAELINKISPLNLQRFSQIKLILGFSREFNREKRFSFWSCNLVGIE